MQISKLDNYKTGIATLKLELEESFVKDILRNEPYLNPVAFVYNDVLLNVFKQAITNGKYIVFTIPAKDKTEAENIFREAKQVLEDYKNTNK
ncbi:hypothetical protein Q765_00450 [Flavobacterium rivuli WB 3.3-2 = DSM 21788]|uniref:Uncharacterized protein n=1 Tax=Flavobacterium rivuli WB 3.3-2 = DSM 21788 TaxID=1121895 RepID=A0A0A2MAC6_9FLAO|nr:hypothetical protein [Flavobacterium rivuli]KGO88418.1 hypothetical protein Q765_00450 [Flavobacterium rivuli WB 3.3-2 = DSM 21788]